MELELSWKVLERSLTHGAFWPFDWPVRARTEDFSPGHQSGRDLWGLSLGGVPGVRALGGGALSRRPCPSLLKPRSLVRTQGAPAPPERGGS